MPTFQPSKFSTVGGPTPGARQNASVKISDGQAWFMVRGNGVIEVLDDTWGNKGALFHPGDPSYDEMIKVLIAARPDNRDKMEEVLGKEEVAASASTPSLPVKKGAAPPTAKELVEEASDKVPFYKQPWFWPVVILGVAGAAGAAYVYWPREGEEEEEVKAVKALPPPPPAQEEAEAEVEVVKDEPVPA